MDHLTEELDWLGLRLLLPRRPLGGDEITPGSGAGGGSTVVSAMRVLPELPRMKLQLGAIEMIIIGGGRRRTYAGNSESSLRKEIPLRTDNLPWPAHRRREAAQRLNVRVSSEFMRDQRRGTSTGLEGR